MISQILDNQTISFRYFFSRREILEEPFWVDVGDCKLACYYKTKQKSNYTIVHFHGNGETVPDYVEEFVPKIQWIDLDCFMAEYRGYGLSDGRAGLTTILSDVEKIVKAIPQPIENLIFYGRSIGSIYAIHAASLFPNAAGLILESGISNLLERLYLRVEPKEVGVSKKEFEKEVNQYFNQKEKHSNFKGSTLIMHTENDHIVDVQHGHQLFEWSNEPKSLKIFERGNHNTIMLVNENEYYKTIKEFVNNIQIKKFETNISKKKN